MKLIVAGGRKYKPTKVDRTLLKRIIAENGVERIVSGCCGGADAFGEAIAAELGLPVDQFPAEWKRHGKAAGPIRNRVMAEYADAVVLFAGGAGTDSMREEARRAGIRILYDARGEGER